MPNPNPDYRYRRQISAPCGAELFVTPRGATNKVRITCGLWTGHEWEHQAIVWHRYYKEVHVWSVDRSGELVSHTVEVDAVDMDVKESLNRIMETNSADPS